MTQVRRAYGVGTRAGAAEQLACISGLNRGSDVLKDISFSDYHAARINLKSMAWVVIPVVVNGMKQGVASDLGRSTGGVVDIVVLECYQLMMVSIMAERHNGQFKLTSLEPAK